MTKNMAGRSVAIWAGHLPGKVGQNSPKLDVHFNYWHIKSQKNIKNNISDFFDIGVMAHSFSCLVDISIYLPLHLESGTVEDLGPLFSNPTTASGIFNESLSATKPANGVYITLQNGATTFARVHVFGKDQKNKINSEELTITAEGSGTLLVITRAAIVNASIDLDDRSPIYFRIRFKVPQVDGTPFSRTIVPLDSWLLSSYENTEFLDFRLNEVRNLPQSITQKMKKLGGVPIVRIDCLVVVGESADVSGGVESNKKRLLESELWQEYINSAGPFLLSDGMVIHHWKKVSPDQTICIGDFSAFIKLKLRRAGRSLVWRYLAVVALIGCLGSLLASVVWTEFDIEKKLKGKPATATPYACQPEKRKSDC
jgi:hypothetical protein